MDTYSRVMAYLRNFDPAVSGSGGHDTTLKFACECFRCGLSRSEVWEALNWYNQNKCSPAWSEKELQHKLESAEKKSSTAGEMGAKAHKFSSNRANAVKPFRNPDPPEPKEEISYDVLPVCKRSAEEEEIWWAKIAAERGTTLEVWDNYHV